MPADDNKTHSADIDESQVSIKIAKVEHIQSIVWKPLPLPILPWELEEEPELAPQTEAL